MIRINLLPHREARRKAQQRAFYIAAGAVLALGVAVIVLVHGVLAQRIEYQNARNNYLSQEIAILDKQIEEIRRLRDQTQQMLARKRVVETLQGNRAEVVQLLDQLARQLPDGVYLRSIKQTGARVHIVGLAQSNARVSTLMRNLEASPWLENASLVEIKAATVNNQRLNEFTMNVTLTRVKPDPASAARPAAAPAKK
jgi:type IV pilus assembly protein PilN